MKKAAWILLPTLVLALVAVAQQATPHRKMTTAEILGFHGPIYIQKWSTQMLEKDPRSKPKLRILMLVRQWVKFSATGELIEEGEIDNNGQFVVKVERAHDPNGEETATEITEGDQKIRFRTERTVAEDGSRETKTYKNGELESRAVGTSDTTTVFDAKGEVISRSISKRDKLVQDSQLWGKEGKFVIHTLRRMDDQGNTIQSDRFDQAGKLVSTMSFSKGELTSFWQDPLCDCTNVAGFNHPGDVTIFYQSEKDGRLYKHVQNHKGRRTNRENDAEELYDQNGQLLERLVYSYERDAHRNWTTRTTSAFDMTTGNMVPIQRDTRELTYY
jgi:hypothetical protein